MLQYYDIKCKTVTNYFTDLVFNLRNKIYCRH